MYRTVLRSTPRAAGALRQGALRTAPRRFASTTPADKKRSWKSSTVRWGLAIGAVYWYSTSAVFAEEPQAQHVAPPPQFSDEDLPTVEAVVAQKRREAEERLAKAAAAREAEGAAPAGDAAETAEGTQAALAGGPEALEAEAGQQGAFNPETGEINWDCPCLGGMADGPCGEEFKAAFSCFVYSKEEPKGMDCIDKFQHMQDCFRLHPDVYGDELTDDEAPEAEGAAVAAADASSAPEGSVDASATSATVGGPVEADVRPAPSGEQAGDAKPAPTTATTPTPGGQ